MVYVLSLPIFSMFVSLLGNLASSGRGQPQSRSQAPPIPVPASSQDRQQPKLVRRHTMGSQSKKNNEGNRDSSNYSYTPYSKSTEGNFKKRSAMDLQANPSGTASATPSHAYQQQSIGQIGRQYSSDMNLSRNPVESNRMGLSGDNERKVAAHTQAGSQTSHQFHTLGRNFRLSGGSSRKDAMPTTIEEARVSARNGARPAEGYVQLYKTQSMQTVSETFQVPVGGIVNALPITASTFAQTSPSFTVSQAHAPPQSRNIGQASATEVQNGSNHPVSSASDGQQGYYKSPLSNRKLISSEFNLLNPPIRSSKPIPINVPKVPPTSNGLHPRSVDSTERHMRPAPQVIDYRVNHSNGTPGSAQNQTAAQLNQHPNVQSHSKYQYRNTMASDCLSSSIPVQVAPPVVPSTINEGTLSYPSYKFTSSGNGNATHANSTAIVTPSYGNGTVPYHTSKQNDNPSQNSSFDSNDPETLAYTEQMSKALEQFSLLTKRPSIIQTSF